MTESWRLARPSSATEVLRWELSHVLSLIEREPPENRDDLVAAVIEAWLMGALMRGIPVVGLA